MEGIDRLRQRVEALRDALAADPSDDHARERALAGLERLADELAAGQHALVSRLLDLVPDPLLVSDRAGMVVAFNRAASVKVIDDGGLTSHSLAVLIARDDGLTFQRVLREVGTTPTDPAILRLRRPPPDDASVEVTAMLVDDDTVLWLLRDRTASDEARTHLQEALVREEEAAERLRDVDDMRRAFLLGVAHDLRSPLAAIASLAELVQRPEISPEDRATALEHIDARARETLVALNDLLDVERFERAGASGILRTEVDVAGLVAAQAAEIPLRGQVLEIDARPVRARVDPGLVRRAVANLIRNAVQHTPAGTTIWVRCGPEPDGVLLVVEDDGPGIEPDQRRSVFDLFARGRHPGGAVGLGVGLSLVRTFAVLHGGWARCEERAGGGASFQVLFPGEGESL